MVLYRVFVAGAIVCALSAYALASGLFKYAFPHTAAGTKNACVSATADGEKKENPNEILFISCGGFL